MSNDAVHHPSHYSMGEIECIDAIRASMYPSGFVDFCKGNVIKYLFRWEKKGGLQDLKKAQVYLTWMIEVAEKHATNEDAPVVEEKKEKNEDVRECLEDALDALMAKGYTRRQAAVVITSILKGAVNHGNG